jgi:hypothetical protein
MQKLPQIHYWIDRVDRDVISVHAVRGWGDRQSNGVFLLMPRADWFGGSKSWQIRQDAKSELDRRLKDRERALLNWYGSRDWRNHLCARVRADGDIIDDFERA